MPINYLKKIQLGEFNLDGYRISPSIALEAFIEGFYVFSRDLNDHKQLIFNDGYPTIVFLQNSEDTVSITDQNTSSTVKGAWASAGSVKNIYVNYNNPTAQLFIVRFHPTAFHQLFNVSASYFQKQPIFPLEKIAGPNNFSTADFFKAKSVQDKIAFVEAYAQQALKSTHTPNVLQQTLDYIHKIKGNSTVSAVSKDVGVSYKWLERSFLRNIGLLPKEYIQLQRFIHAYLELVGNKEVDLMRIAVNTGYYDANHFLKDFKVYTGKTPMEYLKSTF
ncbi:helix-turn-helix domain-containing protein [Pedobacter sp. MC2016-14]|uniref:helix-turn-helix domain-containing protein n=1 Tax=Pedobacter sp. MC2016-14 TaxID=2897327 RepID=UPI001E5C2BC3|nr:helix-turn-helix domain-containing protein [Pedobacter sp. MC2016-14]MCD0490076.1 helix-turn-helix domain-containing protein [Pedobacter sp. MC2016-14]